MAEMHDTDIDLNQYHSGAKRNRVGRPEDPYKNLPALEQRKIYRQLHKHGQRLSAEQTRFAIWDPKTEAKPLSKTAIMKIEARALAKLKKAFAKYNIHSVSDVFESGSFRQTAEEVSYA